MLTKMQKGFLKFLINFQEVSHAQPYLERCYWLPHQIHSWLQHIFFWYYAMEYKIYTWIFWLQPCDWVKCQNYKIYLRGRRKIWCLTLGIHLGLVLLLMQHDDCEELKIFEFPQTALFHLHPCTERCKNS